MLSFLTHDFPFFKKNEIWFYNGESAGEASYTTYCYVLGNFTLKPDSELIEFTTRIDLTQKESDLFKSINTTFKYHIRKAKKIDFEYVAILKPSFTDCKNLITLFNKFAKEKKIPLANKRRILALQNSKNIIITKIKHKNMDILTHVYIFDTQNILLMHTFHDQKYRDDKYRGYANKLLHWKDILLFKEMDFKIYDFGGIDLKKVPGISNFKLSYGGKIVPANNYTRISPFFKLIFQIYKFIRQKN